MLRDALQELRELGLEGTIFRVGWELRARSGLQGRFAKPPEALPHARTDRAARLAWTRNLPFADPVSVTSALRDRIPAASLDELAATARAAAGGRILCFGRWNADFGRPIDWHLNPVSGQRWNADAYWSKVLADEQRVGDVKLTWEVARFPQAYWMSRAAAWRPEHAEQLSRELLAQMESFVAANPFGRGIHWNSGQEVAFRLMAWLFALDVMLLRGPDAERAAELVADALRLGAFHVEQHIDYARIAVYNNHVLSEALLLYAAGILLPECAESKRWREFGRRLLEAEAERQFYRDGAYIQQSHNYHRVALQVLVWATMMARSNGDAPSRAWTRAIERSIDFLAAQQNPTDGRLPNYGANDGALPSILSTCDFSDLRPTLQLASVIARGERLYEPGPWDESAAWALGPAALDAPLRPPPRRSVSFGATGYHVLRGDDAGTFATFRCGSLKDRFSQIDMLHVDVWWKGHNVLVDGGSYLYNGPAEWHDHFLRTASHNTVMVDNLDQMLHFRRFKVLYRTKAKLLRFEDTGRVATCTGEHSGYARHAGKCIHRRSVLHFKDDTWVVVDRVVGEEIPGGHSARLHWLGGQFPFDADEQPGRLTMRTPSGPFTVQVFDRAARPVAASIVAGQESPPRGWMSRYYAEKVAVPSLATEVRTSLPVLFISVLSGADASLERDESREGEYILRTATAEHRFAVRDGHVRVLDDTRTEPV